MLKYNRTFGIRGDGEPRRCILVTENLMWYRKEGREGTYLYGWLRPYIPSQLLTSRYIVCFFYFYDLKIGEMCVCLLGAVQGIFGKGSLGEGEHRALDKHHHHV